MAFWYLNIVVRLCLWFATANKPVPLSSLRLCCCCPACLLKLLLNPFSVCCKVCIHPDTVGMKIVAELQDRFFFVVLYLTAFCPDISLLQVSVNDAAEQGGSWGTCEHKIHILMRLYVQTAARTTVQML